MKGRKGTFLGKLFISKGNTKCKGVLLLQEIIRLQEMIRLQGMIHLQGMIRLQRIDTPKMDDRNIVLWKCSEFVIIFWVQTEFGFWLFEN